MNCHYWPTTQAAVPVHNSRTFLRSLLTMSSVVSTMTGTPSVNARLSAEHGFHLAASTYSNGCRGRFVFMHTNLVLSSWGTASALLWTLMSGEHRSISARGQAVCKKMYATFVSTLSGRTRIRSQTAFSLNIQLPSLDFTCSCMRCLFCASYALWVFTCSRRPFLCTG
jgi:hypothetical protein